MRLGFPARKRGRGLAQRQVTQAHILHELQWAQYLRVRRKELNRVVYFHAQHLASAAFAPGHG